MTYRFRVVPPLFPALFLPLFLFLFLLLTPKGVQSQSKSLHGKVSDEQGKPVAGSSVYLSHTSIGVTTSGNGDFVLQNLPEGKFDLVVSAIGYETKITPLSSDSYPAALQITLSRRTTELAEVVVEPTEKNGWRKYGKYFTEHFIGKTRNARSCKILNPEVLRFRFSEKNNRLTAKADEPIIIENKLLGYKVSFQLIEFRSDYNEGTVSFYGHPFFTPLQETDEKKQNKILSNRREAYHGSLMHFMRAVYEDKLADESFIVKATVAKPNVEKERVIQLHDFTIKTDAYSKFIFFTGTMEVEYTGNSGRRTEVSEIMLNTPKPLEILKNGSYFSPTELVTFKHWSDHEKMCNMLPLDYYPK